MICLHRLRGDELWVNPDLIVFAERNGHDTVVTLADGNRVTVNEPVEEIATAVMQFRSSVLAAAENLSTIFSHAERSVGAAASASPSGQRPPLRTVQEVREPC